MGKTALAVSASFRIKIVLLDLTMEITNAAQMRKAIQSLTLAQKDKFILNIALFMFEDEGDTLNINKDISGGDFVAYVADRLSILNLTPEVLA